MWRFSTTIWTFLDSLSIYSVERCFQTSQLINFVLLYKRCNKFIIINKWKTNLKLLNQVFFIQNYRLPLFELLHNKTSKTDLVTTYYIYCDFQNLKDFQCLNIKYLMYVYCFPSACGGQDVEVLFFQLEKLFLREVNILWHTKINDRWPKLRDGLA